MTGHSRNASMSCRCSRRPCSSISPTRSILAQFSSAKSQTIATRIIFRSGRVCCTSVPNKTGVAVAVKVKMKGILRKVWRLVQLEGSGDQEQPRLLRSHFVACPPNYGLLEGLQTDLGQV